MEGSEDRDLLALLDKEIERWRISLLATDLDTKAIERARRQNSSSRERR